MSKRIPWAIYSGYEMDIETFRTFISNVPEMKKYLYAPEDFGLEMMIVEYYIAYSRWRWHLPKPVKTRVPPILFLRVLNDMDKCNPTPLEGRARAFFFPVRFISHQGEEQFEGDHLDFPKHGIEREADQAKLNAFIEFVESQGGVLTRDMVRFSSMKERHPSVNPSVLPGDRLL